MIPVETVQTYDHAGNNEIRVDVMSLDLTPAI